MSSYGKKDSAAAVSAAAAVAGAGAAGAAAAAGSDGGDFLRTVSAGSSPRCLRHSRSAEGERSRKAVGREGKEVWQSPVEVHLLRLLEILRKEEVRGEEEFVVAVVVAAAAMTSPRLQKEPDPLAGHSLQKGNIAAEATVREQERESDILDCVSVPACTWTRFFMRHTVLFVLLDVRVYFRTTTMELQAMETDTLRPSPALLERLCQATQRPLGLFPTQVSAAVMRTPPGTTI